LLEVLTAKLKRSRTLWMMVPERAITDTTINILLPLLDCEQSSELAASITGKEAAMSGRRTTD
jgi:hypothetical protein